MVDYVGNGNPDGTIIGRVGEPLGFFGKTPVAQPSGAAQAAIVDASGGTAAATNGVLTITGTYNSAILANALATIIAGQNAIRTALVNSGITKGSA